MSQKSYIAFSCDIREISQPQQAQQALLQLQNFSKVSPTATAYSQLSCEMIFEKFPSATGPAAADVGTAQAMAFLKSQLIATLTI